MSQRHPYPSLEAMLAHKDKYDDLLMRELSERRAGLPPGSDSAKVRKGRVGEHREAADAGHVGGRHEEPPAQLHHLARARVAVVDVVAKPTIEEPTGDFERICAELEKQYGLKDLKIDIQTLRQLPSRSVMLFRAWLRRTHTRCWRSGRR